MPPASTEDTILETRPKRTALLFHQAIEDLDEPQPRGPLERCRTAFRELGERMSSFDLSRQIYG
jgi:hypothetical protein